MKKIQKISFFIALIMFFSASINIAAPTFLGFGLGTTNFSEQFPSTYHVKGLAGFQVSNTILYDISTGYTAVKAKDNLSGIKMVPVLGALNYLINPEQSVSSYIGAIAGLNFLSSSYKSPGFTYGAKGGLRFKVDSSLSCFIEASYLVSEDSETEFQISPFNISVGLTTAFQTRPTRVHKKSINKQSPKKREYQIRKDRKRRAKHRRY